MMCEGAMNVNGHPAGQAVSENRLCGRTAGGAPPDRRPMTARACRQAASARPSAMSFIRRSSLASARMSSPVTRPSHMVTMRPLMVRISGSSEETARIAIPAPASS